MNSRLQARADRNLPRCVANYGTFTVGSSVLMMMTTHFHIQALLKFDI